MQILPHKQFRIAVFVGTLETKIPNKQRVNHILYCLYYMIYDKEISFVQLILVHIKMTLSVENWQRAWWGEECGSQSFLDGFWAAHNLLLSQIREEKYLNADSFIIFSAP